MRGSVTKYDKFHIYGEYFRHESWKPDWDLKGEVTFDTYYRLAIARLFKYGWLYNDDPLHAQRDPRELASLLKKFYDNQDYGNKKVMNRFRSMVSYLAHARRAKRGKFRVSHRQVTALKLHARHLE